MIYPHWQQIGRQWVRFRDQLTGFNTFGLAVQIVESDEKPTESPVEQTPSLPDLSEKDSHLKKKKPGQRGPGKKSPYGMPLSPGEYLGGF